MASKRNVKKRTCERKIGYATLAGAIRAKHKMKKKYGESFSAYECKNCSGYHIGHTTQSTRAKLRHLATAS